MKAHYPTAGVVSIWIGTFQSEDAFDLAVEEEVTQQLVLPFDLANICEVSSEECLQSISTLLQGFSGDATFLEAASRRANEMGVVSANSALVCYHLKITEFTLQKESKLIFLGSFNGSDI